MDDCIFCKIASGEIKSEKVYENQKVVSFLDVNPRAPDHTLIIPKEHVKEISSLNDELIGEVFKVTREVVKILNSSLNPDGFTIGLNNGEAAGQEIPPLHVNVIPRFENDKGTAIQGVVNNPPTKEISEIAKRL